MTRKSMHLFFAAFLIAASLLSTGVAYSQPGGGGGMGSPPDFSETAEKLGVTEDALMEAFGDSRPPDIAAAAEKLGVTEDELLEAMPPRPER